MGELFQIYDVEDGKITKEVVIQDGKPKMYYFITDPDGYKIEVIRLKQFQEK